VVVRRRVRERRERVENCMVGVWDWEELELEGVVEVDVFGDSLGKSSNEVELELLLCLLHSR
jgi:hypothetical protein